MHMQTCFALLSRVKQREYWFEDRRFFDEQTAIDAYKEALANNWTNRDFVLIRFNRRLG